MKRESLDSWEDKFVAVCKEKLDEEPFYPYEHLWKKGLSPQEAFEAYLEENDDLAEKYDELSENAPAVATDAEKLKFAEMARKLEEKQKLKKQKEAEAKIAAAESKYCPECGRTLSPKGSCKCGYKRKPVKRSSDFW